MLFIHITKDICRSKRNASGKLKTVSNLDSPELFSAQPYHFLMKERKKKRSRCSFQTARLVAAICI